MAKLLAILLLGLVFESTGVVLLKKGMTQIGPIKVWNAAQTARLIKVGLTNPQLLLGVFFEALFFACLLLLMAKSDISFLWPLTSLSFVFATLAAMLFLNERVSLVRWAGVVLIVIGATLISYSQQAAEKPKQAASAPGTMP